MKSADRRDSKDNLMVVTERLAFVAGLVQPLMIVPQIITIFANQSAEDVSLLTWLGTMLLGLPLLVYGIVHKLRPIIATQIMNASLQIITAIGVIIYG